MKRLKDKKFFGMLSILDIAIIAFILLVMAPALYYYVKFNDKGFVQQKALERFIALKARQDIVLGTGARTKSVELDASFKNITKDMLGRIRKGDKDIALDGTVMAEIAWLGEPTQNYFIVDVGTQNKSEFLRTVPENSLYSLPAKIRLLGVIANSSGLCTFKDKSVKELEMLNFRTKNYEAYFVVEGPLVQKV